MKTKKNGKPVVRWILLGILVILAAAVAINWNLIRTVYYNNMDPEKDLSAYENWAGGEALRGIRYADLSEDQYLNLYLPSGAEHPQLFVLVHGGGFISNDCESRQAKLMIDYFRDHGYACATVNYRLAQEEPFPGALEDVKAAIRFLKANADRYGYDAARVPIWGESAGGYLAVMAGVTADDEFAGVPFIGEDQLAVPVTSHVDAVVDYYGAVEFQSEENRNADFAKLGIPKFVVDIANGWLKGGPMEGTEYKTCEDYFIRKHLAELSEEEARIYMPAYYARKNLSPDSDLKMLIWHGDMDLTVPKTHSIRFYELMRDSLGEDRVSMALIPLSKHAAERMYTDERLAEIAAWLSQNL